MPDKKPRPNPSPDPGFPCPTYGKCIKKKHCKSKGRPSCPQLPNYV